MMAVAARAVIGGLLRILCRIDDSEIGKIPRKGPLILVTNHINFLEVPLIYVYLYPRKIIGIIKRETWKNPLFGAVANAWQAIPIARDSSDLAAMRKAQEALGSGAILAIAPEGTRSGHGRLQRGHPGVAALALRSRAVIVPLAHFGGERFWSNFRRGKRTRVRIRVGEAFRLRAPAPGSSKRIRSEMVDEIMYRIAVLLPPEYRGIYSDQARATTIHLDFLGAR
jgi:1-acyl-sn-glycerol-3-phosphate acyltransferase